MTYRLSEQDARWTHRTSGYPIRGARDELSFLTATFVREQNRKKKKGASMMQSINFNTVEHGTYTRT